MIETRKVFITVKTYPTLSKKYLITTNPQLALESAVAVAMCLLQPEQAALSFFPVQSVG